VFIIDIFLSYKPIERVIPTTKVIPCCENLSIKLQRRAERVFDFRVFCTD